MADFSTKFTSTRQDWTTPKSLYNVLDAEFHFEWDLAASDTNHLAPNFFTEEDSALRNTWTGSCWLNPPYGGSGENSLQRWIRKAYEETRKDGTTVVMLIPARTNTKWFANYCLKAKEIRFIIGRPKFGGADHGLPQPLVLVVFENTNAPIKTTWLNYADS